MALGYDGMRGGHGGGASFLLVGWYWM